MVFQRNKAAQLFSTLIEKYLSSKSGY